MSEIVRIGDIITIQNIQIKKFLCGEGILSDDLIVGTMDSFDQNWFQICLPRQYSAALELKEFIDLQKETLLLNGNEMDATDLRHLNALRVGAKNEHRMNEQYMKTKTGMVIHYGDSIQLLHVKSKKYITVVGHQVAEHERENIRVCLHPTGAPESWLTIQPRFKINQSGDPVLSNAEIKLSITERLNEYLHSTDKAYSHGYREVNASLEPTSWKLSVFQSSNQTEEDQNVIYASELISFFDPETQSMLSVFQRPAIITPLSDDASCISDDDSIMDLSVDGEVIMESSDGKTVKSSALWLLESREIISGGPLQWRTEQVRIKHVNTGMYMCFIKAHDSHSYCLSVTSEPHHRGTLFSVHELHSSSNYLTNKKAVQISHNSWYLERGELREISHFSHYQCTCTKTKSNAMYLFISKETINQTIISSTDSDLTDNSQPLDVFVGSSIRNFYREYLQHIENFLDYNPFLEDSDSVKNKQTRVDRVWPELTINDDKLFYHVTEKSIYYLKGHPIADTPSTTNTDEDDDAVNEFGEMIRNDFLIQKRQQMFYEQHTLDIILILLNTILPLFKSEYTKDVDISSFEDENQSSTPVVVSPSNSNSAFQAGEHDHEVLLKYNNLLKMGYKVSKYLLRLLLQSIKRNQSSQLYVSNHIHVILGWVGIQHIAADVVKEMLNDNLELQTNYIGPNEIKIFTDQLMSSEAHMNNMYFILLKAFCSCQGHGISQNQGYVLDALLRISKQALIQIIQSSNADVDNTRSYFLPSIYLPETALQSNAHEDFGEIMLGAKCLVEGLPYLSVTWQSLDEKYTPEVLYGKKTFPLSDMFRGTKLTRPQLPNSVGGVMVAPTAGRPKKGKKGNKRKSVVASIKLKDATSRNVSAERKEAVVEYMIAQFNLLAELCLERNISAITKIESLIPYDYLLAILSGQTLSTTTKNENMSDMYGASAWLVTTLYIDRESETTSRLPCLSKVWSMLENGTHGIATVAPNRMYRFGLLQHIISTHVKSMRADGGKWDPYSLQIIVMMKKIVNLRFYGTVEKLRDIIDPLLVVLNRRNPEIDRPMLKHKSSKGEGMWTGDEKSSIPWQKKALQFMESLTELSICMVVVLVSTLLAILQLIEGYHGLGYDIFDIFTLLFFAFEVTFRGYVHHSVRKKWSTFFLDHFVQLDISIVALDVIVMGSASALGSLGNFSGVFRTLRLLRLVRVARAARLLKTIAPKESGPVKWALPARYRTAPAYELQTMVCMIDVLRDVQKILDDRNLNLLLTSFRQWNDHIKNNEYDINSAGEIFLRTVSEASQLRISSSERDDIFLDLIMYVNSELVQSVLELLMAHHSSLAIMVLNAKHSQLLISPKRETQYKLVQDLLLQLDRHIETYALWGDIKSQQEKEVAGKCEEILVTLRDACRKRRIVLEFDQDFEPDIHVQNLFRNLGCWEVCWKLLQKLSLYPFQETHSLKATNDILLACNNLLFWYTIDNTTNQTDLFEELPFFMSTIDKNIGSHNIITAIFSSNEELMRKVPIHYIYETTEKICMMGKFPQYLSLLSSITVVGDKNILENQYEIVKHISSPQRQKKILAFCCSTTSFEYQRKIKLMSPYLNKKDINSTEIAAELAYHVDLLKVLAGCTMGLYNITTIETKVQAMFNYIDIIDAMLDPRCLLCIKIQTGLFLYNSVLEVEMVIPSLAFSPKLWQLLEACVDILTPGKDILRQIERNGWDAPTSSRQSVEYLIVICRIVFGFFKLYFDPVAFRKDHLSTYGTQASTLKLSMDQIETLILKLFDTIRSIYELDSPLLAFKHKEILYNALVYLGRAKSMNISEILEITHKAEPSQLDHSDRLELDLSHKLSYFLQCLEKNEQVKPLLHDELQTIIEKISSLPLVADSHSQSTVRYEPLIKKLVDHVRSSIEIVSHSSGREKHLNDRYTKTAIWIIQIFRRMIENAWGMTIYERDEDGGEEQDKASATIVQTFNVCGVTTLCLDLIANGIARELALECIKLSVAMLFKEGGALQIQKTINTHLLNSDSEFFFLLLRKIINDLIAWHDWKKIGKKVGESDEEDTLPEDIIAIRFMQLMCEGHFGPNQDIMREQPNTATSTNLLDDFVNYLVCVTHIPCRTSTEAALAVGATILEVIQGPCEGNQEHFALNTTLIEILNHQMRGRTDIDKNASDILKKNKCLVDELNVKKTGIDIFQALLEGQGKKRAVYERVLSVIHLDVIQLLCAVPMKKKDEKKDPNDTIRTDDIDLIVEKNVNEKSEEEIELEQKVEEMQVLLRTESLVLLQMLCDFKPSLRKELEVIREEENRVGGDSVVYVEIMWRGELQRRFFSIPEICYDFTDSSKSNFVEFVDRTSHENKLLDMYKRAKVIYIELQHQQFIKEVNLSTVFSRTNQNRATWITFTLACAINIILIFFFEGEECFHNYNEITHPNVECGAPVLPAKPRSAIDVLNFLQITFSSFTLFMFLIVRAPVQYIAAYKQGRGVFRSILATALDPLTLYYFIYVILAIGAISSDYLLTFFLLDIVVKNSYAMDVMIAVFTPIKQLTVAIGLSLIVMYIFAMFVFLWLNGPNYLENPRNCQSLFSCWKFTLSYGSSGDFGPTMTQGLDSQWIFYFLFDLAIRFVLLNVVRGITVDTFSELRLLKLERLKDTKETCFICGIDKQIFDRDKISKGFAHHIQKEHNMWNYLYFMIHIWEQDKDDDDGLEQYVRRCIDANDISWIPAHKAMSLTVVEDNQENGTKESFEKNLVRLENSFLNRLNQLQSDMSGTMTALAIVNPASQEIEKEYTQIMNFDSFMSLSDDDLPKSSQSNEFQMKLLKKTSTLNSLPSFNGPSITLEVVEISGLTFPMKILETISCVVRSKRAVTQLGSTHLMFPTEGSSVVVFDPCEIIVAQSYHKDLNCEEIITIQIIRGSPPRYVGKVDLFLSELSEESEQRISRSFYGEILETTSRGTITINTKVM